MKYLTQHIRTQAQAEAPRLLLATLSLLIVGLMLSPRENQGTELVLETKSDVSQELKLSDLPKKLEKVSISRR